MQRWNRRSWTTVVSRVTFVLLGVLGTLNGACKGDQEAIASYHVRGVVTGLEGSGDGARARVTIHHEAVPAFKDRDGHASNMASMQMIFGFGPKLSASSVHVGDKLAFDFDVRWSESPALVITQAQALPADTALVLSSDAH